MSMQGVLACAQYAFPPNNLQYCGPLKAATMHDYLSVDHAEPELRDILEQFETLYPYLACIAEANNIPDPFDIRVIEAYWIGNDLLKNVSMKQIYSHYTERLHLPKRLKQQELKWLFGKIQKGAQAHHTYHVLNVFTRTGHHTVQHTVESIDNCRIGWGKVLSSDVHAVIVEYQPIVYTDGVLSLSAPIVRQIYQPFDRTLKKDYWVSFHWGVLCGVLNKRQLKELAYYTNHALTLANTTL